MNFVNAIHAWWLDYIRNYLHKFCIRALQPAGFCGLVWGLSVIGHGVVLVSALAWLFLV